MERIIDFLFNANKSRKIKMALTFIYILILFIINVNREATINQIYLITLSALILLLANMLVKIFWYHRKKIIMTGKRIGSRFLLSWCYS